MSELNHAGWSAAPARMKPGDGGLGLGRARAASILCAAALAAALASTASRADDKALSGVSIPGTRAANAVEVPSPAREGGPTAQPRLTREEVETVLPLFTKYSETRQLAGEIELRIRQGDVLAAKDLIERVMEASTFAVLASDWLDDPALLRMLHNRGIHGSDSPVGDAARVVELQKALSDEREHAQSLAREFVSLSDKLADVQSAQERAAAAEAQVVELTRTLAEERERAQAAARDYAGIAEKLASVQAAQERADRAVAQVVELQKALDEERQRGQSIAREYAALTDKLANVQSTQSIASQTDAAPAPAAPSRPAVQNASVASAPRIDLRITPTPTASPLVKRADALFRSGDVSGARLLLEKAAEAGDSSAVLLLAETFDPRALAALGVIGVRGDLPKAEELYARAQALRSVQGATPTEAAR